MHLKRQKIPKNWPIQRKGTSYIVRPNFNMEKGIPILIVLRDMLKVAQNRKEVKKALNSRRVLLNNKLVTSEKNSVLLFDVINLVPSNQNYRLSLTEKGKFKAEEIKEAEANKKIAKIVNKKILKGKKIQLNLDDGKNILSDIKCTVNDSVLLDLEKGKIVKCLPLKEKSKVMVFAGNHAGSTGVINKINQERKMVELKANEKNINVLIKQIMIIE
jgi:small subunit ribosomal protein S4e